MRITLLSAVVLVCSLLTSPFALAEAEDGDRAALLAGDLKLGKPGNSLPGNVVAFGERAFVIASAKDKKTSHGVIAAARFGKGRVVVFGHGSYFGDWDAGGDGERFLINAIRWSADNPAPRVAFLDGGRGLLERTRESYSKASECADFSALGNLERWDAIVWVGGALGDEQLAKLTAFVEKGGGVLLGVCPWGNQQIWDGQGKGKSIRTDLAQNKFLGPMGIALGAKTVGAKRYALDEATNAQLHAGRAIEAVSAWLVGDEKRAAKITSLEPGTAAGLVADVLRALPPDDERFAPALAKLLEKSSLEDEVPADGRVTRKSNVVGYLGILFATQAWKDALPEDVPAAPGADFFPGAVPKRAKRIEQAISIGADAVSRGGWISTGLYAVAGEPVSITTQAPAGWHVRIGAHKDLLWHKEQWSRWPEITLERPITYTEDASCVVTSPFGGLVYLIPKRDAKPTRFLIAGVVEAPYFVLGDEFLTADWKRRRTAPAPWAELACDGVVLTIPSGAVRKLDDPTALMEYWSRAMKCYPELRGEPQPKRAERLVEDMQISAGWMHSGYPVMTHGADDVSHSHAVDLETLQTDGNWGYFHEFGHNAQKGEWTFGGTGEVTCNLFSLYLGEQLAGIEPWKNSWLEGQKSKPAKHFANGAPFDKWKSQPGLALMMYATVQREFGWEPFKVALRAYLDAPESERPKNDAEKRDRWMLRLSAATQRNLGPYFEHWGVPTSESARESIAHLEAWMPEEYETR